MNGNDVYRNERGDAIRVLGSTLCAHADGMGGEQPDCELCGGSGELVYVEPVVEPDPASDLMRVLASRLTSTFGRAVQVAESDNGDVGWRYPVYASFADPRNDAETNAYGLCDLYADTLERQAAFLAEQMWESLPSDGPSALPGSAQHARAAHRPTIWDTRLSALYALLNDVANGRTSPALALGDVFDVLSEAQAFRSATIERSALAALNRLTGSGSETGSVSIPRND